MRRIAMPLILICLLLGLAVEGNTMSAKPRTSAAAETVVQAQGFHRILLACPTDVPDSDALCQALIIALQRRAPDHDISRSHRAPNKGELVVTLHISSHNKTALIGFLSWKTSASDRKKGPPITLGTSDTNITARKFPSFANGLVALSDLPIR